MKVYLILSGDVKSVVTSVQELNRLKFVQYVKLKKIGLNVSCDFAGNSVYFHGNYGICLINDSVHYMKQNDV